MRWSGRRARPGPRRSTCRATTGWLQRRRRSPGRRRCRRARRKLSPRGSTTMPGANRSAGRSGTRATGGRADGGLPRTFRDARLPARLAAAGGAPARRGPRDAGEGRPARAPSGRHAGRARGAGQGNEQPRERAARGRGAGDERAVCGRATVGGQVPPRLGGARRQGHSCPRRSLLRSRPPGTH